MMRRTKLSEQVERHATKAPEDVNQYDGSDLTISTGSTLLDLAISGGRFKYGGIPSGIMVEIFGPASCGKTVLLCELAGGVLRQSGKVMFFDPEARLNNQFAKLFGLDIQNTRQVEYATPDTIPEVFKAIRDWDPPEGSAPLGVFADSLAALTTQWELEDKDQYGMRRAKEFSEQCRLTCRILAKKKLLMICSNQIRQNLDAGLYGQKYKSPGGEAIGFYSSLRLRCGSPKKIKRERTISGKKHTKIIGVETSVEVFKSSVWEPHHTAPIYILYDYGIDDIRANLQFVKSNTQATTYFVNDNSLGKSIEDATIAIEHDKLEGELRQQVVHLWNRIEKRFKVRRESKYGRSPTK